MMSYFWRCLSAEILKTRRSLSLLGVVVLPTLLSFFNFLLLLGLPAGDEYASPKGWVHFEHNTITFGGMFVFPAVIVLVSAFTAHQEHDPKMWRRLMCLAVPKMALYLAKLALLLGLTGLSGLVLWAENVVWGVLFFVLRPDVGLSPARLALGAMLAPYLWIFLFALLIAAIHFWFALRVQNFGLSIGLGFALILAGAFLHREQLWRVVFPWALPSLGFSTSSWVEIVTGLLYSLTGFIVVVYLGCRSFARRDVFS
jgi:hypothetical protein